MQPSSSPDYQWSRLPTNYALITNLKSVQYARQDARQVSLLNQMQVTLSAETQKLKHGQKLCVYISTCNLLLHFLLIIIFLQKMFMKLFPKQLNREKQMPQSKTKITKQAKSDSLVRKRIHRYKTFLCVFFFLHKCGAAYMIFQNTLMTYALYEPSCNAPTNTEQFLTPKYQI